MIHHFSSIEHEQELYNQEVDLEEAEIVLQVLAGNSNAFEYLVKRYSVPLFNYIYRFFNDTEIAADILQEVFVRFYTSLPRMNLDKPFKPWLFQVAHNRCVDELRSRRRRMTFTFSSLFSQENENNAENILDIEDASSDVEQISEHHDLQAALHKAITALPIKPQAVVILRYTTDMTFSQIGSVLNMPEHTAKTYFCRSKKILQQKLQIAGILDKH
jgi:RNA polymerase sigma-70 factor (ECF subfamily)